MQREDRLQEEERAANERHNLWGRSAAELADQAHEQQHPERTEGEHHVAADGIATPEPLDEGGEEENDEEKLDEQDEKIHWRQYACALWRASGLSTITRAH
ncbi:MAG: hypothetical protein E6J17_08010 [Chloroflexi bacterium]|nr:MAG: hypothetical protein E6J17_08010 [Chloroflexota bacterium]